MTFENIKQSIKPMKNGNVLFRPTKGGGFIEIESDILFKSLSEIVKKADIDEYSECERLSLLLLKSHAEYFGE